MELLELRDKYIELSSNVLNNEKFNMYSIIHHSNLIEGSTLTLEETYLLLDENLTPKNKPLEHTLMATDHLKAFKYVMGLAEKKTKLTVDIIKKISAMIMHSTGSEISSMGGDFDSSKGDFRKLTVRAGSTIFMNYLKVPSKVKDLVDFINTNISEVKTFEEKHSLAFKVHFEMVTIHPFADGNGRISRLLMNYVQLYHKEPMSVVLKEDKSDYIFALKETRKIEDINIFTKFMFSQLEKYLKKEIEDLTNNLL